MSRKEVKGFEIILKGIKTISDQQLARLNLMVANEISERVEEGNL